MVFGSGLEGERDFAIKASPSVKGQPGFPLLKCMLTCRMLFIQPSFMLVAPSKMRELFRIVFPPTISIIYSFFLVGRIGFELKIPFSLILFHFFCIGFSPFLISGQNLSSTDWVCMESFIAGFSRRFSQFFRATSFGFEVFQMSFGRVVHGGILP